MLRLSSASAGCARAVVVMRIKREGLHAVVSLVMFVLARLSTWRGGNGKTRLAESGKRVASRHVQVAFA